MLTIKNYYTDSPMNSSRFSFVAGCTMYNALEKTNVYEFSIRDKSCAGLCKIYLTRDADPNGHYTIWGHNQNGHAFQKTAGYKINAANVKDWNMVAHIMNKIIGDILKEFI